jgi:hypothetical protein
MFEGVVRRSGDTGRLAHPGGFINRVEAPWRHESCGMKGKIMRIVTMTVILGLPHMALSQTADPQQTQAQTKETQTTAVKGKKTHVQEPGKEDAKPQTNPNVHGQINVKGRAHDVKGNQPAARSSTSETNVKNTNETTTVNKEGFRSRHTEVFALGRHPKEFFVLRYGRTISD